MMKISFSTISCPAYSVDQIIAAARQYGYDGVELYALSGRRLTVDLLAEQLDAIRGRFRAANLPIVCLNSWGQLSSADPAVRAVQEAQIRQALALAAELDCPLVKTFGGELPPDVAPAAVYDSMADVLLRLSVDAARLGVRLVLETHDGFSLGARVAELLRRVDDPAFAALWDVHHPYRAGETLEETALLIGDRVAHVHVKDAVHRDQTWQFVPLGEGELPVQGMLQQLARREFHGYVSLDWEKMWYPDLAGPEVILPQAARVLREYIAGL